MRQKATGLRTTVVTDSISVTWVSDRVTYDSEADAAYFLVAPSIDAGESAETVVIERPPGTVTLDFDHAGHLLELKSSALDPY